MKNSRVTLTAEEKDAILSVIPSIVNKQYGRASTLRDLLVRAGDDDLPETFDLNRAMVNNIKTARKRR